MINRRGILSVLVAATTLAAAPFAYAAEHMAFTQQALDAAQKAGKPILIDVTAPWCPICKAQKPILADLAALPKFKNLEILEVDFDSQKDALRAFNIQKQSTLVIFKGGKEVDRSTGDTNAASIGALLDKAI